jgi:hypothetical protein
MASTAEDATPSPNTANDSNSTHDTDTTLSINLSTDPPQPPDPHAAPSEATDAPSQAMLDQYSHDLQALPSLLNATQLQEPLDHATTPPVGAHENHHPPPSPPPAQATHRTLEDPDVPDSPPQPSPQLPPTEAPDRTWRLRAYPLTTPSFSTSPRWQHLIQDPSELDIKSYSCGQEMDLNTGTLNIGGSLRERITDITFTFAATQMDYLCLQDTRQTKREGLIIANLIHELLPPGSLVLQAPIVKAKPSDPPPQLAVK